MLQKFNKFLSPKYLLEFCSNYWRITAITGYTLISAMLVWIFLFVPDDFQQGQVAKMLYIHVPSAILSMGLFASIGILGFVYLVYRIKLTITLIRAILPVGLMLTCLVLITGMIWGKPTWGTWWIWDARLTSELILAFLYFAIYVIAQVMRTQDNASIVIAALSVIGLIDLPIIHYSVNWWHTLHQGPSILAMQKPTIAWPMLWPLLVMLIGIFLITVSLIMLRSVPLMQKMQQRARWLA